MENQTDLKAVRRLFQGSAIYGLVMLLPQYFMEAKTGIDFPPAITHPEFYYGFLGVGVAWQLVFLKIASDPIRFKPLIPAGMIEKLGFGIAAIALFGLQRTHALFAVSGAVDLVFAAAFFWAMKRIPGQAHR